MSSLIWVFPSRKLSGKETFSDQWIISKNDIHASLSKIVGSSVWVVQSRSSRHHLFGHIKVINIAKNIDQIYNDLLTLYLDKCASFQILPAGNNDSEWELTPTPRREGLYPTKNSELREFINLMRENKKILFKKHRKLPPSYIKSIKAEPAYSAARLLYGSTLEFHSLGDLHYSKNGKSPFGELALQSLPKKFPNYQGVRQQIIRLDRVVLNILENAKVAGKPAYSMPPYRRQIDTDLTVINPDQIYARLFLSSLSDVPRGTASLLKTQRAEKRHQDILKAAANALLSMKLVPSQSSSIDLAVKTSSGLFVFEIKSATKENIAKQVKQSFLQILEYRMTLKSEGHKRVFPVSIVENLDVSSHIKSHLKNFATHLGVKLIWFQESTILSELKSVFKPNG